MLDREFALRFIAFYELGVEKYKGSIDFFLNETMDFINNTYDEARGNVVEELYIRSLVAAYKIFDRFAFRKILDYDKKRPVNKALFEVWTVKLATYSDKHLETLIDRRDKILDKFMKLCTWNKDFDNSLKSAKVGAVRKRFEWIGNLIEEVLRD